MGLFSSITREFKRVTDKVAKTTGIKPIRELGRVVGQTGDFQRSIEREFQRPFERLGKSLSPDIPDLGPLPEPMSPLPSTIQPVSRFSANGLLGLRRRASRSSTNVTGGRGLLRPPDVRKASLLDTLG